MERGYKMKKAWILAIVVIVILGVIFIPKLFFNEGDNKVKFKVLASNEIPEKLQEVLPRYIAEERALACKIDEKIYIIVTRGEKKTGGYSVSIDKIEKVKNNDGFDLIVYSKYVDPKPDVIVPQIITYPLTVVKTELDKLPEKIKLEIKYQE